MRGASPKSPSTGPEVRNAFRPLTVKEMLHAFDLAHEDPKVGVIILTGAGDLAFCSGGDQKVRGHAGYIGEDGVPRLNVLDLQKKIRSLPKPVIAMVAGYAIGGGHVLHIVCDLTIAADNARFGQTGPKVGSFDGGLGSSYLARIVGQKKAREIWYLCRQYDAQQALDMGLVNTVVPLADLETETAQVVPRNARTLAARPALPQIRPQRRLRRPDGPARPRRQRHPALLHERGRPRRETSVPRKTEAGFLEIPAGAVNLIHRLMLIRNCSTYQNSSATLAKSDSAAATCWPG